MAEHRTPNPGVAGSSPAWPACRVIGVGTMAVQTQIGKVRELVPRSVTFLQEVWAELKKVHWPTRKETYAATAVVLVIVGLIALYLGTVDFLLSQVVGRLLR